MSERPFRVLGVQQIALGGLDKTGLRQLFVDLLGLTLERTFRSAAENVDEDIVAIGSGARRVELDLMQPLDPNASPRVHTPALHHFGLWVDDLGAAVAWLGARGVRFAGPIRMGAAGLPVAFIHPKGSAQAPQGGEGVLIELVQAPPELAAEASEPEPAAR